jgi:zinc/manganese transport system permease protein
MNPVDFLQQLLQYPFMQHAFEAGTVVALVAGAIGYFVVLRSSAFAAHALSHIGFAGATGAVLVGVSPLIGLLVFTIASASAIGALAERIRGRDATIGIVLAFSLALGLLFLSLYRGYATLAYALLFGQILGISQNDVVVTVAVGMVTLVAIAAMYRPLLFASVDEDVAAAKGVPVLALSVVFMIVVAIAVSEAVQVVGVLLIFALIVTPPSIAARVARRPGAAVLLSALLALAFTWIGLTLAYYLPLPVSVFITSLAFGMYLLVRLVPAASRAFIRVTPAE